MTKPSRLAELTALVWAIRLDPGGVDASAKPALEEALGLLAGLDAEDPAAAVQRARIIPLLAGFAKNSKDISFGRFCFAALPRLGFWGRSLAVELLFRSGLPDVSAHALFNPLPPQDRLLLINHFFMEPARLDHRLLAFAHEQVRTLQGEDPEETLLFLERLHEEGGVLSHAVQREFLKGRFGLWLDRLWRLDLDPEQERFLAKATSALRHPGHVPNLCKRLRSSSGPAAFLLIEALAASAGPGDAEAVAALGRVVETAESAQALAALRALPGLDAPKRVARLFWGLSRRAPDWQRPLAALVWSAGPDFFEALLELGDESERAWLTKALAVLVCAVDGKRIVATVDALIAEAGDSPKAPLLELKAGVAALTRNFTVAAKPAVPPKSPQKQAEKGDKAKAPQLERILPGDRVDEAVVAFETLVAPDWSDCLIADSSFEDVRIEVGNFTGTRFVRCRFTRVGFPTGTFDKSLFSDCVFKDVDFSHSRFTQAEFRDFRAAAVDFWGARFDGVRIVRGEFAESLFTQAVFDHGETASVGFARSDFTLAHLVASRFDGAEFVDCNFSHAVVDACRFQSPASRSNHIEYSRFWGVRGDDPLFLYEDERTRAGQAASLWADCDPESPPLFGSPEGRDAVLALLRRLFTENELKRRKRIFLAENLRRFNWARSMPAYPGAAFLVMLPGLVEAGRTPGAAFVPRPRCRINGFTPGIGCLELLEHWGVGRTLEDDEPPIPIEAVFTIGSVGSVAQARSSDMDVWICVDESKLSDADRRGLAKKLAALEVFGESAFGLELHFYVMDMRSIRACDFGPSHKDSSGGAQPKLLQEEFQRTALLVAGKKPSWWFTSPGGDEGDLRRTLDALSRSVGLDRETVLDMGAVERIPRREFFGAALWQIVKAMHSPFKSVMKFALLDAYMSQGGDASALLCAKIKTALLAGGRDLWEIDPYAVMFREVSESFRAQGRKASENLMRTAFWHKTRQERPGKGAPGRFKDASRMQFFFPASALPISRSMELKLDEELRLGGKNPLVELTMLGEMIVSFLFETYQHMQERLKTARAEYAVNEDDLTKMGRKVLSYLKRRPHKIRRIPFVDSPRDVFASLEFHHEGRLGKPGAAWVVKAAASDKIGARTRLIEVFKTERLETAAAWLVANGVYTAKTPIAAGRLEHPVSFTDLTDLMKAMLEYFPPEAVFDVDLDEYLQPEKVTRAFLAVNFTVPREERTVKEACLLYLTNWGELFCHPNPTDLGILVESPTAFVARNTGLKLASNGLLGGFAPRKSQCPSIYALG